MNGAILLPGAGKGSGEWLLLFICLFKGQPTHQVDKSSS
jgi:hypothetical protein